MQKEKTSRPRQRPSRAIIQYKNLDMEPVYVEGAMGGLTQRGSLHVSFFADYLKPPEQTEVTTKKGDDEGSFGIPMKDPFGIQTGNPICVVRRIEASIVFTEPMLRTLIPWLQSKLDEIDNERDNKNKTAVH